MSNYDAAAVEAAIFTVQGEPELTARWVNENLGKFRFVDVREPHELEGPLGQVEGVENVPLLNFIGGCDECSKDIPTVIICRSGRRSALAVRELKASGTKVAASVEGGMIAWNWFINGKATIVQDEKTANADNLVDATYNTNGVPEVSAHWTQGNLGRFKLIDVRNPHELDAIGYVPQAENIPLGDFLTAANEFERDQPIVVMCQAGGRSARAVRALVGAGFTKVASMEGGMLGWLASGLPHAGPK